MRRFYALLFLPFLFALLPGSASACGYSFIGDCSTRVHLRINGSLDSFFVAACPYGIPFQGLDLGNIQTLNLANAHASTWESCQNNVTNVGLFYRVFESGQAGGAWQVLNLAEEFSSTEGPYTTRFRGAPTNASLTAGLTIGKNYTLEVYFRADVDTIGDDFIPETFLFQNNGGQNYRLTFTYGGPTAPPFTVLTTRQRSPSCFGASDGAVGVSVYGNPPGLFYAWAGYSNNFYTLENVAAGTYSVTVSEAGGYSHTQTIVLGQPPALSAQFTGIQGINCAGTGLGQATAVVSGGTSPYTYAWQNGQSTPSATFASAGNWALTVTDAHLCTNTFTVTIPVNSIPVEVNRSGEICLGETYTLGGQTFTATGQYEVLLGGGCDTLVHLSLAQLDPSPTLSGLPDHIALTCLAPSLNLCATSAPATNFFWEKDGLPAQGAPCLLATAGGTYKITAVQTGQTKTCAAQKIVTAEEHLFPPAITTGAVEESLNPCSPTDSIRVHFYASANPPDGASFTWLLNGNIVSTEDSLVLFYPTLASLVAPTVQVAAFGCVSAPVTPTVVITQGPLPAQLLLEAYTPDFCQGLTNVVYDVLGGTLPYSIAWPDTILTTNGWPPSEVALPPGLFQVTLTDGIGCMTTVEIPVFALSFTAEVQDASAANAANGQIDLSPGFYFPDDHYQWSNGATGPNLSNLLPGDYCLTITDDHACTRDTCFTVSFPSAAPEPAADSMLHFYPNPTLGGEWLTINGSGIFTDKKYEIELRDLLGRTLFFAALTADNQQIRFILPEHLAAGAYQLEVNGLGWKSCGLVLVR